VTSHVFTQTTYTATQPPEFACVVITTNRCNYSFIEMDSGTSQCWGQWAKLGQEGEIRPFTLLWLLSFTTACTNKKLPSVL